MIWNVWSTKDKINSEYCLLIEIWKMFNHNCYIIDISILIRCFSYRNSIIEFLTIEWFDYINFSRAFYRTKVFLFVSALYSHIKLYGKYAIESCVAMLGTIKRTTTFPILSNGIFTVCDILVKWNSKIPLNIITKYNSWCTFLLLLTRN